jgi:hypothetical protein
MNYADTCADALQAVANAIANFKLFVKHQSFSSGASVEEITFIVRLVLQKHRTGKT